jgi:galactokinase/mevalonate kinase-like predicted kinase
LIEHIPELILGISAAMLVGALGFFLKRSLNEVSAMRKEAKESVVSIYKRIDGSARDIMNNHNQLCHERQGACAALMDVRFKNIDHANHLACQKIAKLDENMEKRWEKQERLNEKLLKLNGI